MAKRDTTPPLPPDPPIERVRIREFTFGPHTNLYGPGLLCPRCGEHSLCLLDVVVYDREVDERGIRIVRISGGAVLPGHTPWIPPGEPGRPLHGVLIEFGCNSCCSHIEGLHHDGIGHGIWLEIVEERYLSTMCWCFDPLPEGYDASPPA